MTREVVGAQPEAAPKQVSRRNKGGPEDTGTPLEKFKCTRLVASELKATKRPSGLMAGAKLAPLASAPSAPIESRLVAGTQDGGAMRVSRQIISCQALLWPCTRVSASEAYTPDR